jgi:ubiquinone/menaquinone biosynthesis C-methylase UbiE
VTAETEQARSKRHFQRTLFDGIADRYAASRPGYPDSVVGFVVQTVGLGAGSAVLEIGCGTGELTVSLALFGFSLTAIDIGPSMIAAASRRLAGTGTQVQVTSFEDFAAADASFDLVISGAAFHWIDPEIRFSKAARLLRPGGWLAQLGCADSYDDPVGPALDDMWAARDDTGGAWVYAAPDSEGIAGTGLFGTAVRHVATQRLTVPAEVVFDVERTRATYLSWPAEVRQSFAADLRRALADQEELGLTRQVSVTMARVSKTPGPAHP